MCGTKCPAVVNAPLQIDDLWLATLSSNVRSFDQGFSFSAVAVTSGPPFFLGIRLYSLSINSISGFSKRETPGKANHIKISNYIWHPDFRYFTWCFFSPQPGRFKYFNFKWGGDGRPGHITWRFSIGDLPKQLVYSIYNWLVLWNMNFVFHFIYGYIWDNPSY